MSLIRSGCLEITLSEHFEHPPDCLVDTGHVTLSAEVSVTYR